VSKRNLVSTDFSEFKKEVFEIIRKYRKVRNFAGDHDRPNKYMIGF